MRVLLVMNGLGWAGAETQLCHLALGLSDVGHTVEVLAIGGVYIDSQPLTEAGVEVVDLAAYGPLAKLRKAGAMTRHARRADVVHCTGWDATFWGRLAAFLARRPMLITEHTPGRDLQLSERGASRVRAIALHNRVLGKVTYANVVVAKWQIDLLESEGVKRDSIVHIPNAVPVDELRQRSERGPDRDSLGIPGEARVIVQVARFWPQKGQLTTLRAVARLRETLGDVRVLFVGEGPEEEAVKQEASRLGADWAVFLGLRDDVPGLLRLADLAVLPSTGEGLPMSLIEAMAIGTPVVATDVGDVRWLIETWGGGICVESGDDTAFQEACGEVLGDEATHSRLSEAALQGADGFDSKKMIRRYEELFEAAVASAPIPRPESGDAA